MVTFTSEATGREGSLAIEELLQEQQARFIQEVVDTEVEEFLGRKRYEHSKADKGYRNGSYPKKVKLPGCSVTIQKPHLRKTREKFVSRILRGVAQLSEKLRTMALEMYIRGLSTRDIETTLREPDGKPMFSRSTISTLSERLYLQYQEFSSRDLSEYDIVYLFVDGVYESVKRYTNNQSLLCVWAICSDVSKRFLYLSAVESESQRSWEEFFENMKKRGLRGPLIMTCSF